MAHKHGVTISVFCMITFILTACTVSAARDENNEIPEVVLAGLDAYGRRGPVAAVDEWIKRGPIPKESTRGIIEVFRDLQIRYGGYEGYELIDIEEITTVSKVVYIQMNFQNGPIFLKCFCYHNDVGWIITGNLQIDSNFEAILPPHLIKKRQPA